MMQPQPKLHDHNQSLWSLNHRENHRNNKKEKERPLAPPSLWNRSFQIFPQPILCLPLNKMSGPLQAMPAPNCNKICQLAAKLCTFSILFTRAQLGCEMNWFLMVILILVTQILLLTNYVATCSEWHAYFKYTLCPAFFSFFFALHLADVFI